MIKTKQYLITYLMDGFYEHIRVYAKSVAGAKKEFRVVMGSQYEIVEIEQL